MCFYAAVSRALGYREHLGRVCKPSSQGEAQGAGGGDRGQSSVHRLQPQSKSALGGRSLFADALVPMEQLDMGSVAPARKTDVRSVIGGIGEWVS